MFRNLKLNKVFEIPVSTKVADETFDKREYYLLFCEISFKVQ